MTDIQSNRDNHPLSQEGYALMAAAFEVHNELGGGLLEEIYQECLELELGLRGIPFQAKQELHVFYKKRQLKKRYVPDLHVHGRIVVGTEIRVAADPRSRGPVAELHAACASPGRLPDQLRAHRQTGMETVRAEGIRGREPLMNANER